MKMGDPLAVVRTLSRKAEATTTSRGHARDALLTTTCVLFPSIPAESALIVKLTAPVALALPLMMPNVVAAGSVETPTGLRPVTVTLAKPKMPEAVLVDFTSNRASVRHGHSGPS